MGLVEFLIIRLRKLSWSRIGRGAIGVLTLLLRKLLSILHKLHKDSQCVFLLSKLFDASKSDNLDVMNNDEKQSFMFNHQACLIWVDFESKML
jgi:hypothetical protein